MKNSTTFSNSKKMAILASFFVMLNAGAAVYASEAPAPTTSDQAFEIVLDGTEGKKDATYSQGNDLKLDVTKTDLNAVGLYFNAQDKSTYTADFKNVDMTLKETMNNRPEKGLYNALGIWSTVTKDSTGNLTLDGDLKIDASSNKSEAYGMNIATGEELKVEKPGDAEALEMLDYLKYPAGPTAGQPMPDSGVGLAIATLPGFQEAFAHFAPDIDIDQKLQDLADAKYDNDQITALGKLVRETIQARAVVSEEVPDNSTTNLTFNGNVDISVKADALPDGDSPTAAPKGSTEQTGIVVRSYNSGVTNVTFKKDLTVKATAPNEANGLTLQAPGGTVNFTADGKVTAKAEGTSPAAGYGVEVASDNGGTTTAKFNKGLDTEGSTHGIYVRSIQRGDHSLTQKFGTSTATVEGDDVRIVSQKAPLYNADHNSDLAGAILVDGKNTSLTVNKNGGHKVEVVGDINTTMDGKVSLNLDTAGSSIKGNIHAFNESQSDISLSGEGNDLTGAAQSGLYFDTGTTGTLNLALKDGAAWKVTDVSDATTLSLDNGAVLDMPSPWLRKWLTRTTHRATAWATRLSM